MDVVLRSAIAFLFLWVMFRILGRRELSQLSAFELVLLMAVARSSSRESPARTPRLLAAFRPLSPLGLLALLFSWSSFRFASLRRFLEGDPVVIENGVVNQRHFQRQRFSLDDLKAEARSQGIENLEEVRAAILEPDGRVSFLAERPLVGADKKPIL